MFLRALAAVLGPFWTALGRLLGDLGDIRRPQKPIVTRKGGKAKHIENPWFSMIFTSRGYPWEAPWPLGAVLWRSWRLFGGKPEAILNHLEVSGAIMDAILGDMRPSWERREHKKTP